MSPKVVEGFRCIGDGRLDDAERVGREQLSRSPNDPHAWHLIGILRLKQGRLEDARLSLVRAVELSPQDAGIRLDLGRVLLESGDVEEAATLFSESSRLRRGWAPALYNRGVALRRQGRLLPAAQAFAGAAQSDPRDYPAVQASVDCVAQYVRSHALPSEKARLGVPTDYEPLSIVFCSRDERRLAQRRSMLQQLAAGTDCEVIAILAPSSLASAYNAAAVRARHERIVFIHDDVEFLSADALHALSKALDEVDMVGLAGSRLATGPAVAWAGQPNLRGWISYPATDGEGFDANVYSLEAGLCLGMQTLDGLLIAVRRPWALQVLFDVATFDRFDFYDLDFTVRAHRAGCRIAVTTDVLALHESRGRFGKEWNRYKERFMTKFPELNAPMGACHAYAVRFDSRAQLLSFYSILRDLKPCF